MSKLLCIGDVHGRDDWEDIIAESLSKFHKIVFVGDYIDSFHISAAEQMYNLKRIIEYKKKYSDVITLLLGNHDIAAIDGRSSISGYQFHYASEYRQIFKENHELFQVAQGYINPVTNRYTLVTHAGLTMTYYNKYMLPLINDKESHLDKLELHEVLNFMRNNDILWKVGSMRGGTGTPGPLWADYVEFLDDPYTGINQIFGHTAAGTVEVTMIGDDLIAKVDGNLKGRTANILLNI